MEEGAEKRAWRREQRRRHGEGNREEGMEEGAEKRAWRREQRRGHGERNREEGMEKGAEKRARDQQGSTRQSCFPPSLLTVPRLPWARI